MYSLVPSGVVNAVLSNCNKDTLEVVEWSGPGGIVNKLIWKIKVWFKFMSLMVLKFSIFVK